MGSFLSNGTIQPFQAIVILTLLSVHFNRSFTVIWFYLSFILTRFRVYIDIITRFRVIVKGFFKIFNTFSCLFFCVHLLLSICTPAGGLCVSLLAFCVPCFVCVAVIVCRPCLSCRLCVLSALLPSVPVTPTQGERYRPHRPLLSTF